MKILLGFEVGSGEEVFLEDGHTVVTGMTQLSGKTTCLEALVKRGEIRAVTFLTKRGESGFREQRGIQPYFREQKKGQGPRKHALIDWQYVSSILEAVMGEKMKLERSFIINACKGAHSLKEVYENIKEMRGQARRGFDESIYTNLAAYFEIILPQIQKYNFADRLRLSGGFNVMNLIDMTDEMQQLVIESVLSYVLAREHDTVVVIPEAHKFIPQGSNTPVKGTALRFIREGAAVNNFMWIDTQETTSVDKALLKQCSNWIMGYQQEKNEVANVRENIGRRKIKDEDIMTLKLGHFIASLKQKIHHIYVLPAGIDRKDAIDVAKGFIPPEVIKDMLSPAIGVKSTSFIEVEKPYREMTPVNTQDWIKIQTELTEMSNKTVELQDRLEKAEYEFKKELQKLKLKNDELKEELEKWEALAREQSETLLKQQAKLGRFEAFELALMDFLMPKILKIVEEQTMDEVKKMIEMESPSIQKMIQRELSKFTPTQRRTMAVEETSIPWVNIWLPKLTKMQRKIISFMASRYPLQMTKTQIAQGTGYSIRGGSFNQTIRELIRWKLLEQIGKEYKLAEGPPG